MKGDTTVRSDIIELGFDGFNARLDQLLEVYASAMQAQQEQLAGRRAIMAGHTRYPGFRALAATEQGQVTGFCYGFCGMPGQWWHDRVAEGIAARHGQAAAQAWLGDCLEVAELHVLPQCQGRGAGTALLGALGAGRTERTALLSTPDTESTARRLYRTAGFTDLLTGFRFEGAEPPYAVMGAGLPLRLPSPSRS
jgi:ribosomal protein S18 acetylase RimI-like enzyme